MSIKNKKPIILLTGGSGYIGTSLRKRWGDKYNFKNFDIRNNLKDDVRDLKRLRQAVRGIDGVLHLAAISRPKWGFENPYLCLTTNIDGTFNVLEAVRTINPKAWVILGSSREVFGNLKKFPGTELSPRVPLNAYGVSKMVGEELLRQYAENYGLRCLTIRFCGVYTGTNDILDRVTPKFIGQALHGENITIEGGGEQKGDYVYIDDVMLGVERAMRYVASKPKGFYDNISFVANQPISLKNLAKLIIKLSASKSKIIHVPARTYDQRGFWGSYTKAKKLLGWEPKISLEEGLRKSIAALKPIVNERGSIR